MAVLIGYAILNFLLFEFSGVQTTLGPVEPGDFIVRGYSGYWVAAYGLAYAILYSAFNAPELFDGRTCPRGHAVSLAARYCPKCGTGLNS